MTTVVKMYMTKLQQLLPKQYILFKIFFSQKTYLRFKNFNSIYFIQILVYSFDFSTLYYFLLQIIFTDFFYKQMVVNDMILNFSILLLYVIQYCALSIVYYLNYLYPRINVDNFRL